MDEQIKIQKDKQSSIKKKAKNKSLVKSKRDKLRNLGRPNQNGMSYQQFLARKI